MTEVHVVIELPGKIHGIFLDREHAVAAWRLLEEPHRIYTTIETYDLQS